MGLCCSRDATRLLAVLARTRTSRWRRKPTTLRRRQVEALLALLREALPPRLTVPQHAHAAQRWTAAAAALAIPSLAAIVRGCPRAMQWVPEGTLRRLLQEEPDVVMTNAMDQATLDFLVPHLPPSAWERIRNHAFQFRDLRDAATTPTEPLHLRPAFWEHGCRTPGVYLWAHVPRDCRTLAVVRAFLETDVRERGWSWERRMEWGRHVVASEAEATLWLQHMCREWRAVPPGLVIPAAHISPAMADLILTQRLAAASFRALLPPSRMPWTAVTRLLRLLDARTWQNDEVLDAGRWGAAVFSAAPAARRASPEGVSLFTQLLRLEWTHPAWRTFWVDPLWRKEHMAALLPAHLRAAAELALAPPDGDELDRRQQRRGAFSFMTRFAPAHCATEAGSGRPWLDEVLPRWAELLEPASKGRPRPMNATVCSQAASLLPFLSPAARTSELCFAAVRHCGNMLAHVPAPLRTRNLCYLALRTDPAAAQWVPEGVPLPLPLGKAVANASAGGGGHSCAGRQHETERACQDAAARDAEDGPA